jgi:ion channel-forming bestrophin family protein
MAYPPGLFHMRDRERIFGLVAAYAVSLKRTLRDERDLRELKSMLSPHDMAGVQAAPDMPAHCLYILNAYIHEGMRKMELSHLSGQFHTMMLLMVKNLASFEGRCRRIKTYRIAYGYLTHLRLFMWLWLAILPLSLSETSGWWTILWSVVIAFGICGMEKVAQELSDPFGYGHSDIRLGLITQAIQKDVRFIYKKSIRGSMKWDAETPDLLAVSESEGGNISDKPKNPEVSVSVE